MKKRAFTLAEMMIVITIIGILTAIILPSAFKTSPDENIMKFKKGYMTLGNVIRELVTSEQYYADGLLAHRPDSSDVTSKTYFCSTFGELLSVKKINCQQAINTNANHVCTDWGGYKNTVDSMCSQNQGKVAGGEIITADGIVYYQGSPGTTFNDTISGVNKVFLNTYDTYGFRRCGKSFCMDVDGVNQGEEPFGFVIMVDGKIFPGARAEQWILKELNEKE